MTFSLSECIIWATLFAAQFVAIVTVNLLSIILFIKNRSLHTRRMYLVISLTIADVLVGGVSGSVYQFVILEHCDLVKFYPPVLHRELPLIFFPFASLTNIAVISVERFHATFRPFRHRLIKRWVYVVAIAVVWVFTVIAAVIWVVEWLDVIVFHIYLWESYCCLCLIVTFVSYTSILFKFRYGAHPQRHYAAAFRQRKLTVTLLITTLVSLLLWLPYNTYFFVFWLTDSVNLFPIPKYLRLDYALRFLYYANSLVNPILYTIRMPDFKKALLSLFRSHQRENVATKLNR